MKYNPPEYESNIPDRHTRGLNWLKEKIIVLAGSREQFENYLEENGLTDSDAIYGYEPLRLYGIRASKGYCSACFDIEMRLSDIIKNLNEVINK